MTAKGFWLEVDVELLRETTFNIALRQALVVLAVLVVTYSILYFVLRKAILLPLGQLHKAMMRVRGGDMDARADVESKSEIGELAETFNSTVQNLKKSQAELQEAKLTLEVRVAARTRELKELTALQEKTIQERTKDLQAKVDELERFQRLTVGREMKMIELKKEITKLLAERSGSSRASARASAQEELAKKKVENNKRKLAQ